MQRLTLILPAMALAGAAAAQADGPAQVLEPRSKAPPPQYRSALVGYRPFNEPELADWRRANDEVGAAGGHAGHLAGQGRGGSSSKPQPGAPESTGASGHHEHRGHGGHR